MAETTYALILDRCGLSLREAAEFHGVRPDTVKSWRLGRRAAPPGALAELRALYTRIERAAGEALKEIARQRAGAVELGLASDDAEARALGWPCVGAQAAVLGLVAARAKASITVVPRGSTPATADRHDAALA